MLTNYNHTNFKNRKYTYKNMVLKLITKQQWTILMKD